MANLRERLRQGINFSTITAMEIGALNRPFALKSDGPVIYVDHADTESLRLKYKNHPNINIADIVDVDAVWGNQTLAECLGKDKQVDLVFASHVIEHVPDVLTWLQELRSILKQGGEIRLAIPDKRFTFDFARNETQLHDVLDAHIRKTRTPLPRNILDHLINVVTLSADEVWNKRLDLEAIRPIHSIKDAIRPATSALKDNAYHDVHCWVFTPHSFARLMRMATESGLLDLSCKHFEDTLPGTIEFIVHLEISNDADASAKSWAAMERRADQDIPASMEGHHANIQHASTLQVLERVQSQLLATQEELRLAQARNEQFADSTSWKMTAPLRSIMDAIRRL